MLTWLRELAATAGTFDRSALEPGFALRCTIGVAIPLVIAALLGKPSLGVAAAIGAFITGFTSLQGIYRTRLLAILGAAFGMAVTSFIGALAAHSTVGVIAATAVAAYACGTIGQLGPAAATVALNSLVAFVLFSSQPLAPGAALMQSGLVLGGGLIQAVLVLLASPAERLAAERSALAEVYENLAEYARRIGSGSPAMPPITPFATARQVLADPQPFARAGDRARLERLLEDSELIRKLLGALATTRELPKSAGDQLDAIAGLLRGSTKAEAVELAELPGDLGVNLRDAVLAASMLSSGRLPNVHLLSKPRPGPYVENHIEWRSRDSLRSAVVMSLAMVLGRHFEADRGYWIPMTAAIVLRPDFQTTFLRGFARIAGTLVGAIVATLVLRLVRGHEGWQVAGVLVAAAAAYLFFNPNYALFTVAITSFVVLVLSMRGLPGTTTIAARVLDTDRGRQPRDDRLSGVADVGAQADARASGRSSRRAARFGRRDSTSVRGAVGRGATANRAGAHRRMADTHDRRGLHRSKPPRAAPSPHHRRRTRASDTRGNPALRACEPCARERAWDAALAGMRRRLGPVRRCARRPDSRTRNVAARVASRNARRTSGRGPLAGRNRPHRPAMRRRTVYRRAIANVRRRGRAGLAVGGAGRWP